MTTKKLSRRSLLISGGAAGAAFLVTLPGLESICGDSTVPKAARVKLSPIPGVKYRPSVIEFMRTARFSSPRDAIYGLKTPEIEYYLENVKI